MITREAAQAWLDELKTAWEAGNADAAVTLFSATETYYERPFKAGTTREEIEGYWTDIDGLQDISFEYEIVAVDGNNVCAHWQNSFRTSDAEDHFLDGMFLIQFDDAGKCRSFRQWWFARP